MAELTAWKVILQALQILVNILGAKIQGKATIALIVEVSAIETEEDRKAVDRALILSSWHRRMDGRPETLKQELEQPTPAAPNTGLLSHTHSPAPQEAADANMGT